MAQDHNNSNDNNDLFNRIVDSDPFLKCFFASSRPIVAAMTEEEIDRFINTINKIGKGK
jgi:hypothetical protein